MKATVYYSFGFDVYGNDLAVIILLLGSERFGWWTCYWELNHYGEKNILHVYRRCD